MLSEGANPESEAVASLAPCCVYQVDHVIRLPQLTPSRVTVATEIRQETETLLTLVMT